MTVYSVSVTVPIALALEYIIPPFAYSNNFIYDAIYPYNTTNAIASGILKKIIPADKIASISIGASEKHPYFIAVVTTIAMVLKYVPSGLIGSYRNSELYNSNYTYTGAGLIGPYNNSELYNSNYTYAGANTPVSGILKSIILSRKLAPISVYVGYPYHYYNDLIYRNSVVYRNYYLYQGASSLINGIIKDIRLSTFSAITNVLVGYNSPTPLSYRNLLQYRNSYSYISTFVNNIRKSITLNAYSTTIGVNGKINLPSVIVRLLSHLSLNTSILHKTIHKSLRETITTSLAVTNHRLLDLLSHIYTGASLSSLREKKISFSISLSAIHTAFPINVFKAFLSVSPNLERNIGAMHTGRFSIVPISKRLISSYKKTDIRVVNLISRKFFLEKTTDIFLGIHFSNPFTFLLTALISSHTKSKKTIEIHKNSLIEIKQLTTKSFPKRIIINLGLSVSNTYHQTQFAKIFRTSVNLNSKSTKNTRIPLLAHIGTEVFSSSPNGQRIIRSVIAVQVIVKKAIRRRLEGTLTNSVVTNQKNSLIVKLIDTVSLSSVFQKKSATITKANIGMSSSISMVYKGFSYAEINDLTPMLAGDDVIAQNTIIQTQGN